MSEQIETTLGLVINQKEYVCEKHGNVGELRLTASIPSRNINIEFCVLCWIEKLEELGVKKLKLLGKQ